MGKITICSKLILLSNKDLALLKDLMRRWSSAYRYAYKRLLEGKGINDISKQLQNLFGLNSRYSYSVVIKAQATLSSAKEKGENPKKVIFGGRSLFEKLKKRHINGEPYKKLRISWTEKRKGNLYSIGQAHCKGNQNTRIEIKENGVYLRINVGTRQYIYALIKAGDRINKLKEIALSGNAYSVELKVKDGEIYAYFTTDEKYPPIEITKEYGVIGIDLNAYPNHMAWAETDEYGNLISYGKVSMPELSSGNKNKRDNYTWLYAHQVVKIAKTKGKAIVIERLDFEKSKNKRGDYSGRKIRRIQHSFAYKKLLSKIKLLAKRNGIQVIEINPSHTSTIGMLKYAPQYMLTKDVASAYVIARRGLGLKEKVPKVYKDLLKKLKANVEYLTSLKEYVKEKVKNAYLKAKQLKLIDLVIKSLKSEPRRVLRPLDGTSKGILNPWQVLKVVVLTALSPERVLRDLSVLKEKLFRGLWGDPIWARAPAAGGGGGSPLKGAIFETP